MKELVTAKSVLIVKLVLNSIITVMVPRAPEKESPSTSSLDRGYWFDSNKNRDDV